MSERGPVQSTFKEFDSRVNFFQNHGRMPEDVVVNYNPSSNDLVKVSVPDAKGRRSTHLVVPRSDVPLVFGSAK